MTVPTEESVTSMDDETKEAVGFALVGAVFLGLFTLSCWAFVTLLLF